MYNDVYDSQAATAEQDESRVKMANARLREDLMSRDPLRVKRAENVVDDFTRTKLREDGVLRKVLPSVRIADSDLDRLPDHTQPVKIVDMEPDSPAAISMGFNDLPDTYYMASDRYLVNFARISTPRFTQDVDLLRTNHIDLRQVLSDNSIKEMLAEEDSKFFSAVDTAVGSAGSTVATSGVVQHKQIAGGITRDTLFDGLAILPSTPSNLNTHCIVLNNLTILKVAKMTRNEIGGDMAEDIMRNGWTSQDFMGVRWLVTIKKGLVATNVMYHFADPKFMGKHYELEPATMYIRRRAWNIEFFSYETIGATIGNTSSVAKVEYV